MAKIGVQAMMLKESFAAEGVYETLEQVSALGYSAIEVSQIAMTPENVDALDAPKGDEGDFDVL